MPGARVAPCCTGICARGITHETACTHRICLPGNDQLPGFALDLGSGFSLDGAIEIERTFNDYADFNIGYGSVDLTYQSDGPLGGFVGFDAFYSRFFDNIVPYAALSDYVSTVVLGGNLESHLDRSAKAASVLDEGYLFSEDDPPLGLRYDGVYGALKVGLSYHDTDDAKLLDLAANYAIGQAVLRGGVEQIREDEGDDYTNTFLGAEATFGTVTAGMMFGRFNEFDSKTSELYLIYQPTDALSITAAGLRSEFSGTSRTDYGLSAEYRLENGAFLDAGVSDTDFSRFYNISLGWKF